MLSGPEYSQSYQCDSCRVVYDFKHMGFYRSAIWHISFVLKSQAQKQRKPKI